MTNKKEATFKKLGDCPFCEMERYGESSGWGLSPEGWRQFEEKHKTHKPNKNDK